MTLIPRSCSAVCVAGICSSLAQMVRMFAIFRQDNSSDQDFKYLHVFSWIEKCEKWAEVWRTLDKAKETYKPDASMPGVAHGLPEGNKSVKSAKDVAPATAHLQESIKHCIANAKTRAAQREEKTKAGWSKLMTTGTAKLDLLQTNVALLRTNIVAKKRNTDLAFLMGGADMLQSNDEQLKAWYMAECGLILNRLPPSTPSPTATPKPTTLPSPSDDASTAPSSTEAAPTPPSTEAAPTPPSPRTPSPPTPKAAPAI